MNYYIQGNKDKADQIKAAFKKKGIDVLDFGYADKAAVYFSIGGCVQCVPYSINIMNILHSHPDYKELELPVEPKFKKGDWIAFDADSFTLSIKSVKDGNYYFHQCASLPIKDIDEHYHLWTIADAKDGDILSAKIDGDNYILIFKQIKDCWVETYGHYYITIDKFCTPTQMFCRDYQGTLYPATQEQRDMLFSKMREAGYTWDAGKKELKKIQPHYDISNFQPFDKVLVKYYNDENWKCGLFSHLSTNSVAKFVCVGSTYVQCIPFNDDTKHLLGTTGMPSEEYINW